METGAPQTSFPTPNIYQTNELQLWITTYLHACRSRNLSEGTIEFYKKKLGAFIVFCLENDVEKIGEIHADLIRHFLIVLAEKGHRSVYLGEKSRQALQRYMKKRIDHNPALWISKFGDRLSETGLRMMLRRRAAHRWGSSTLPTRFSTGVRH